MVVFRYLLLFTPFGLAVLLQNDPASSYLVAWGGSFLILFLTLAGKIKPLPGGRSLARQLLRPLGLTQLMFAGYTAITSIFYFADLNGYFFLQQDMAWVASSRELMLAAAAQRYYVLAHAAFSIGVLVFMDYRRSGEWKVRTALDLPWLLLYVAAAMVIGGLAVQRLPGLGQLQGRLDMLAMVAGVLSFAVAISNKDPKLVLITGAVFGFSLVSAAMSGWKSEVVIIVLLLAVFLYPMYRRTVATVAPIGLLLLFALLPTYNGTMRELTWRGDVEAQEAIQIALDRTLDGGEQMAQTNWQFLTSRLSEIGMFTKYIDFVPEERPYYRFEIVENGLIGLVPRALWSDKPNMEHLSSERVYEAGIVDENASVSAKPKFVVDAFLSWGALGVLIGFLFYGAAASWASRLAERWFGGYLLGSGVVFTAFFSEMWMSNTFEFFFNNIVWSFILMGALFVFGRATGYLVRDVRPARKERPARKQQMA